MGRGESQYLIYLDCFLAKRYVKMGSEDTSWHTEENCSHQPVSGHWTLVKLKGALCVASSTASSVLAFLCLHSSSSSSAL